MKEKHNGLKTISLFLMMVLVTCPALADSPTSQIQDIDSQDFEDNPAGLITEKKELGAAEGWQDSGVKLNNGDLVYIKADGLWMPGWPHPNYGPEGTSESIMQTPFSIDCPFASLLGRIGESNPFCLGGKKAFLVTGKGALQYSINEIKDTLSDNKGSMVIEIQIRPQGLVVSTSTATDQKKVPLAVYDFHVLNIPPEEGQVLNMVLRAQLAQSARYQAMERNHFERIARKQGLSRMDVADPSLAGRIGKSAGVKKVLLGEAGKLGETYTMTLTLVDVETGQVEKTASKSCKCAKDDLVNLISELAAQLGK